MNWIDPVYLKYVQGKEKILSQAFLLLKETLILHKEPSVLTAIQCKLPTNHDDDHWRSYRWANSQAGNFDVTWFNVHAYLLQMRLLLLSRQIQMFIQNRIVFFTLFVKLLLSILGSSNLSKKDSDQNMKRTLIFSILNILANRPNLWGKNCNLI